MGNITTLNFRQDTLFAVERDDGAFVAVISYLRPNQAPVPPPRPVPNPPAKWSIFGRS